MSDSREQEIPQVDSSADLDDRIGRKAERRVKAQQERRRAVWFGLGMFGLVGWTVAVPTLIGAAVGIWLDREYSSRVSWTLTLLIVGVVVGCLNAWRWLSSESEGPK